MNISHLTENELTNNDDFSYQKSIETVSKPSVQTNKATLMSEMLILLDDTTPSYVLGYN